MITPQERRIARDLAVIYGTYGIIWGSVYMATDWGSVPQWITASVAFGALIVAGIGIWMQRHVARQRAAIDFFIKTEMDRHLVEAYDNFWKGINEMGKMTVGEFYSSKEGPVRDHYFNVRKYLNVHELIALESKTTRWTSESASISGVTCCSEALMPPNLLLIMYVSNRITTRRTLICWDSTLHGN